MGIERIVGESDFDYHKRLIYGKLVDKTLADIDYSELGEAVYGQPYASDVTRRMMYGSRKTLELAEKAMVDAVSTDASSDIDSRIIELRKEKQRLSDQRREYRKLISAQARREHLNDILAGAARSLDESIGKLFPDDLLEVRYAGGNEAVVVFSDWHYGMTTDNLFNTYDTEICKTRVRDVVNKMSDRIVAHGCSKVHIVILGDMIHGGIHVSARVASSELVVDQLMQVSEILAQAIAEISKHTESVDVHMTYGNHARLIAKKEDSIHRDNIERIIPWWLEQRFKDCDKITVYEDCGTEVLCLDVCGHSICASHGDLDSVKSSPRLLTTLLFKERGLDIEYILLGDKHHRESFEELGITSLLCGALCGADDYASDKRLYSTPSQMLLIFNDEGLDAEYRIKCK